MAITVDTNHGPGSLNIPEGARNKSHPLNRCPGTSSEGWHQLSERHFRRQNSNHRIYEWLEIQCNNVLAPRLVDEVGNASCRAAKAIYFAQRIPSVVVSYGGLSWRQGTITKGNGRVRREILHQSWPKWRPRAPRPAQRIEASRRWGVNEGK